jgi:trehalose synthase
VPTLRGMPLHEVPLQPLPIERFQPLVGAHGVQEVRELAARLRAAAPGRRIWNVNSTAFGGGVAELLRPLVAYARGLGIDARWGVIDGPPGFFRITKRLHNALHGEAGDRSPLGAAEHSLYDAVSRENAATLLQLVRAGDVALLHDPQTAGLTPYLADAQVDVVWRCHVGRDEPNAETAAGWRFLAPYLARAAMCVFSRRAYVPAEIEHPASAVVMPTIDPFSAKNAPMSPALVRSVLCHTGLLSCPVHPATEPLFQRADGSTGEVRHCADVMGLGPPPPDHAPVVAQVSRWDALKDPVGVMMGFARLVEQGRDHGAHLVLAGPNVNAVADDPDGAAVFAQAVERLRALPHETRRRVHLATLPTHDAEENAAIVNALQRHATVVVQKSLREGFGLTVTEAMWKGRPVLASAVGGLLDQVEDGVTGLLVRDPADLVEFGDRLERLLADPALAARLGEAAHVRVRGHFLGIRSLAQYGRLIERLDAARRAAAEAAAPLETRH